MQQEQTQVCQNCKKQLLSSKMATHFGYCRRNIKKCQQCGEMFDINLKEQHQEQFHSLSTCDFCKLEIPSKIFKEHADNCSKKPKYCQFCQLNIPLYQFQTHIQQCESRTKICERCGKTIVNKFYFSHLTSCQGEIFVQQMVPPKYQAHHIEKRRQKIPLSRREQFETCQYPHLAKSKEIKKQNRKQMQKRIKGQRRIIYQKHERARPDKAKTGIEVVGKNAHHQPQRKAKPITFIDLQDENNVQDYSVSSSFSKPNSFSIAEKQRQKLPMNQINPYGVLDQDQLIQQAIIASLKMANEQKHNESTQIVVEGHSLLNNKRIKTKENNN